MFDFLYEPDEPRERAIWGDFYIAYHPPTRFPHGQEVKVASLPKIGGDGQPVDVYESRWPARFMTVKALADTNSINQPQPAFTLAGGSGDEQAALMVQIAKQITQGRLTCRLADLLMLCRSCNDEQS